MSITYGNNRSEEYSDLTIVCEQREFKVHKVVICTQIKPFAAMMSGFWTESASQVITLQDEDADVVEDVINYTYNSNFQFWKMARTEEAEENFSMPVHLAKLYIFGDKWDIPKLQKQVVEYWNAKSTLPVADEDLYKVIPLVWHSILKEEDALKLAIAEMVRECLAAHSALCDMLVQVPEFWRTFMHVTERHAKKYKTIEIPYKSGCRCGWREISLRQCYTCHELQATAEQQRLVAEAAMRNYSTDTINGRRGPIM